MVTKTIDITAMQVFKDTLMQLLEQDTELILVEGTTPVAKVIPIEESPVKQLTGSLRGLIEMSDNFDDPLPDEFWFGKE